MITRAYIDNYRSFSNFEFKPRRINLLLGLNGSGKSSFIDAVDRISVLVLEGRNVEELFTEADRTLWDSREKQRFEFDFVIDGEIFSYSALLESKAAPGGMELAQERVACGSRTLFHYRDGKVHLHRNDGTEGTSFPFRGNRSFLGGIEERPETRDLTRFLGQLRDLRGFRLEPPRMVSMTSEEQQRLNRNGENFASWYRHLAQERAGDIPELFEQLRTAVPGFHALSLKGAGMQGRARDLIVQLKTEGHSAYEVPFDGISDGQRALITLYALLVDLRATPSIVLMDEPENYVGLPELQPWLQLLDEALGDSSQLFLISHHPEVIDFLAAENPVYFERPGDGPVRVKSASFEHESGLKASEQIARGYLDV